MKLFLAVLFVIPSLSMAARLKLPNPKSDQEICYYRAYSNEHLKAHPDQKIKGVALTYMKKDETIYSRLEIVSISGISMSSYGIVFSANGKPISRIKTSDVLVQMHGDNGRLVISQDQNNSDNAKIKIISSIEVHEENWMENPAIPEGTKWEMMEIGEKSEDALMVVERARSNGSAKTCSEILETELRNI